MNISFFALATSELGVSSITLNSIFILATFVALSLPMYFLIKKGNGSESALSKF